MARLRNVIIILVFGFVHSDLKNVIKKIVFQNIMRKYPNLVYNLLVFIFHICRVQQMLNPLDNEFHRPVNKTKPKSLKFLDLNEDVQQILRAAGSRKFGFQ